MQLFTNILVGVDLARYEPFNSADLDPSMLEPVHWGIQLAKTNSARLLFFSAGTLGEAALAPLPGGDRAHVLENVLQSGNKILEDLVQHAQKEGVQAQSKRVAGEGWFEIIQEVIRDKHDLVVVGKHDTTKFGYILLGNSSLKLMRRCPCPVLITQPVTFASAILGADVRSGANNNGSHFNIAVATDLKPSSEQALRLGIDLAKQMNAQLHILHVVEYDLQEICNIGLPDTKQENYRRRIREQAQAALQEQLATTDYQTLGPRLKLHLAGDVNVPDVAIQHFIETNHIHLLVMGTFGRGGTGGIMIGNTTERLLPRVHCSVLAVKPSDYVSPVEA